MGSGGRRAGAGRKPKPPGEKQAWHIQVSLTEAEYEALADAAQDEPLASYIRRVLLRHLARRK